MTLKDIKIISISDLHIFKSKRFNEHITLFDKFIKILCSENPTWLVIVGDVIDSKLNVSSEQFEIVRKFLIDCSLFTKVLIIPGNHDVNLQNKERKGLLEVVINSIDIENLSNEIIYIDESGIYNFDNKIDWAIWSCLDNQRSPFINKEERIKYYTIGLYHGAIKGCKADNGFTLTEGIDIEEFDKCNIVIAGDIHMQQNFRNNEINYCGSFIQTKENEEPHGSYLVYTWNKLHNNFHPEVKKIDNEHSIIRHEVLDTINIPDIGEVIYPQQTIKLIYDKTKLFKSDILEYKKKFQKVYPNNKVEIKPKLINKQLVVKEDGTIEIDTGKLNIAELFEKYLLKESKYLQINNFQEDREEIIKLDNLYDGSLNLDRIFEPGDYHIEQLKVNNLFSFPPSETIFNEFSLNEIIGINGKNTSGKCVDPDTEIEIQYNIEEIIKKLGFLPNELK